MVLDWKVVGEWLDEHCENRIRFKPCSEIKSRNTCIPLMKILQVKSEVIVHTEKGGYRLTYSHETVKGIKILAEKQWSNLNRDPSETFSTQCYSNY